MIGVCAIVGSPDHRLTPVAPEDRLSTVFMQSAPHSQLISGGTGGQVDAVVLNPITDWKRLLLSVVYLVEDFTLHTSGASLVPVKPQVEVRSILHSQVAWWI